MIQYMVAEFLMGGYAPAFEVLLFYHIESSSGHPLLHAFLLFRRSFLALAAEQIFIGRGQKTADDGQI